MKQRDAKNPGIPAHLGLLLFDTFYCHLAELLYFTYKKMEAHSIYCTHNYCAQTSPGDWEIKQARSSRSLQLQNTEDEQVSRQLQYHVLSAMMGRRIGCQGIMSPRPGGAEKLWRGDFRGIV